MTAVQFNNLYIIGKTVIFLAPSKILRYCNLATYVTELLGFAVR